MVCRARNRRLRRRGLGGIGFNGGQRARQGGRNTGWMPFGDGNFSSTARFRERLARIARLCYVVSMLRMSHFYWVDQTVARVGAIEPLVAIVYDSSKGRDREFGCRKGRVGCTSIQQWHRTEQPLVTRLVVGSAAMISGHQNAIENVHVRPHTADIGERATYRRLRPSQFVSPPMGGFRINSRSDGCLRGIELSCE